MISLSDMMISRKVFSSTNYVVQINYGTHSHKFTNQSFCLIDRQIRIVLKQHNGMTFIVRLNVAHVSIRSVSRDLVIYHTLTTTFYHADDLEKVANQCQI